MTTYYKGMVGKEDIELGIGTFIRRDKRLGYKNLNQFNASHLPFLSQPTKYVDDLADGGYDVDLYLQTLVLKSSVNKFMTTNETFTSESGHIFWRDANGASRTINPSGDFEKGHSIILINIGDEDLTFDSTGLAQVVETGQRAEFIFDGSDWTLKFLYVPQTSNVEISNSLTTDHTYSGIYSNELVGENIVFGDALYLNYSDGKLWKADADDSTKMPVIAIALGSISADAYGNVLRYGFIRDDSWNFLTKAALLYASQTTGSITDVPPYSTNNVQAIGYVVTTNKIFFNPDLFTSSQIERSAGGFINGLNISNNVSDASNDIDIATGSARDSTDSCTIKLASAITKRLDATWAAGTNQGGLFSGSKASGTWYHVFLILKNSDATVDVGFDTSVSCANIPSGYTKFRRIGSIKTDGSSNILAFSQKNDEFLWSAPPLDVDSSSPGTSAVTRTLSTPLGVKVTALVSAYIVSTGNSSILYVSSPDVSDQAPSLTASPLANNGGTYTNSGSMVSQSIDHILVRTNTSSQIRTRNSDSTCTFRMATYGWYDDRGK